MPPLTLAETLLAQDTPASQQQAWELLTQMHEYFGSIHYTSVQIRVLALQAILYRAMGDEPQALAVLSNSIALAEPGGFLRFFADLGEPLKPLLRKLAQRGVAPAYIAEILAAFGPAQAVSSSTLLTHREREVLQLLAQRYTDKEIAEALVISPKTVSSHIDHLGDKLGARGRRAIVEAAKEQKILN